MSKRKKSTMLEALSEGRSYTWTVPDGGDLASMRQAIKHGQTLTMSPIAGPSEIKVGDLVLVKWHKGDILHLVGEIQDDQYLIVNSLGKVNGWVNREDILGRITKVIDPEPRPSVPRMMEELEAIYSNLIRHDQIVDQDAQRLYTIIADLRWYAYRLGEEQWDTMPRSNKWSFAQNLWKLTKQARTLDAQTEQDVWFLIDRGKECVGQASEILALFESKEKDSGG